MNRKLLIVDVAALGRSLLGDNGITDIAGMKINAAETVFPAVTCTVQGSFRTASPPQQHGMIANGLYYRDLHKAMFWEQSSRLVEGQRIWEPFHHRGGRVGMLFWQQSLGEDLEIVLSPAPVHKHGGGIIMDCLSRPVSLYTDLRKSIGKFPLHRYWGPLASTKSGKWIAEATARVLSDSSLSPDLLMTYIPSLDYDLQRYGPKSSQATKAVKTTLRQIEHVVSFARLSGYEIVVFGDYAIGQVTRPAVLPNLALRKAGFLDIRVISSSCFRTGMDYPDLHNSRAFAVVDHEVANIYVSRPEDISQVKSTLESVDGIEKVLEGHEVPDNPRSGELVAVAEEGSWLAYPWWENKKSAPDYASHVDIHNKPGYDPCELFFGALPTGVSMDTSKVAGSHGRTGPGREVAWATTIDLGTPDSILELSANVKAWLEGV